MPQTQAQPQGQANAAPAAAPLMARVQQLVLNIQFVWFLGHLTTVLQTALFFLYGLYKPESRNYYKAYYGTLLSYGVILYKSHGVPQFNTEYLRRLMLDENSQYFLMALIWVSSKTLSVTLVPYAIFSFLHVINYVRNEVLPTLFGTPEQQMNPIAATVSQALGKFVTTNHAKAIQFVAAFEVWTILPMSILSIFTGHTSLFTPVLYLQFLSHRYAFSPVTKVVVRDFEIRFDGWIGNNPSLPEWARNGYFKVKEFIARYDLQTRARQQQTAQ